MRVVWLGTLALAVACLARPARAEPAAAPGVAGPSAGYQLSYDAPADCPGQTAFEAALKVRLPAAHASLAPDAIRLHVELASPGAGRARCAVPSAEHVGRPMVVRSPSQSA